VPIVIQAGRRKAVLGFVIDTESHLQHLIVHDPGLSLAPSLC
jgi:hypothetical protein